MKNPNPFKIKRKLFIFTIIIILTILITRGLTYINDPNKIIYGFELHHFYYGLFLLIIITTSILFGRLHPQLYLTLSAISIGLIIDELIFVMGKVRGPIQYTETLTSALVFTLIIIAIVFITLYDIIGRIRRER